jgi:exosortase
LASIILDFLISKFKFEPGCKFVAQARPICYTWRRMSPAIKDTFKALPPLLVLGWLWFLLINHLRIEWTLNEQYNYGWAVPGLCLILALRRLAEFNPASFPGPESDKSTAGNTRKVSVFYFLISVLALAFAPIRLFQESNPEWRLISWALAFVVVGLTLLFVRVAGGQAMFRILLFPIAYFFIAVPWPSFIEHPVIQRLTAMNATVSTELLGLIGVPALARGNVIEISSGVVGIDEACSGIRSLQAMLMLALCFGEWYRLRPARRWGLCAAAFATAAVLNLLRTTMLVFIAARHGLPAMAHWHDPAGIAILLGGFTGLWLIALWLRQSAATVTGTGATPGAPRVFGLFLQGSSHSGLGRLAVFSLSWLMITEIAVQSWYWSHERNLPPPLRWAAVFPTNETTFAETPLPPRTTQLLRQNFARNASWRQEDGSRWQATFLRWNPGSTAVYLARNHTPEVCLAAAGGNILSVSELEHIPVGNLALPVRFYTVGQETQTTHVLYCLWSDRSASQGFDTAALNYSSRIGAVLAGQRLCGQRSLQIAVWGIPDTTEARAALIRQLRQMVRAETAGEAATDAIVN